MKWLAAKGRLAMLHVAIDLGGRESQICVRDGKGAVVQEGRWPTKNLDKLFRQLPAGSRVIAETCAEAFSTADAALAAGHEVRAVLVWGEQLRSDVTCSPPGGGYLPASAAALRRINDTCPHPSERNQARRAAEKRSLSDEERRML